MSSGAGARAASAGGRTRAKFASPRNRSFHRGAYRRLLPRHMDSASHAHQVSATASQALSLHLV